MGELTLPHDAVLIHIGPKKTGTTAIQHALSAARDVMAEHGARYPCTRFQGAEHYRQMDPMLAVMGRRYVGLPVPPISEWEALVAAVREARDARVCISSEDLASARPEHAARIVDELGVDRVHVVVTARRLDRLLPSQWQQRIKNRETLSYPEWLAIVLGPDTSRRERRRFWNSHDLTLMYDIWGSLVGPDRFTVIASDDTDRRLLHDTFEEFLDLPPGTLQSTSANSSLSAGGVELVRRLNVLAAENEWSEEDYRALVRRGAADRLKGMRTDEDAPIPPIPAWAVERINEHSREREEFFATRGVRVVGNNLAELRSTVEGTPDEIGAMPEVIALDQVAGAVRGLRAGANQLLDREREETRRRLAMTEEQERTRLQRLEERLRYEATARARVRRGASRLRAAARRRLP